MVRCPTCGRRLASPPICPKHGAYSSALSPSADSSFTEDPWPQISGYQPVRILGRGGFGTVFGAARASDGLQVAIKVARRDPPSAGARLVAEVKALRAIGPPVVPEVYESGKTAEGSLYAVLEFIPLHILSDQLDGAPQGFSLSRFATCAEAILAAVQAVHSRNIAHGDLKPENIFLEEATASVRLVDLGQAQLLSEARHLLVESQAAMVGTPEYMAPEQCRTGGEIDARTDVYSLGVIFYEMLSSTVPFFGSAAEVQEAQRSKRPPRLPSEADVPAAVDDAISRCLAKDPAQRFNSVSELRSVLREALASGRPAEPARSAAAVESPARPSREKRLVGLLFFTSLQDVASVQTALASVGGQLAHFATGRFVGAFGHEVGDNPARRAWLAAQELARRGICERALIDLAQVVVQPRAGGGVRYLSPLFSKADRFPTPADPEGVLLSDASAKVLADLPTEAIPGRPGVHRLLPHEDGSAQEQVTLVRQGLVPLVGREDVLEGLIASAQSMLEHRAPTIATVIAAAGHGKSHLCLTMVERLRTQLTGCQLIQLRAREPVGGDADQTLRELLRKVLRITEEKPAEAGRPLLASRLGPEAGQAVWAGVALIMGWVAPDAPELRELAAAPGVLRAAAANAAGIALRQWASVTPMLFVLDDAQFADEATLNAIEFATLAEAQAPIWACVLARPNFESGRSSWAERSARQHFVRLGPLGAEGAAALCRRLLLPAENIPAEAIERLVARTQGVPLLLVELVRALKSGGLVRQHARTQAWYLATDELDRLPDLPLVDWLAARELESLPPDLAAHARLAALLGGEFEAEDIAGVLHELDREGAANAFPLDAGVGTQRLIASGVLVSRRHGQLSFRHALVRDAVYKSVPEGLRLPIHQAAVRFYRSQTELPEHRRLPRLAFHAARSGMRDLALTAFFTLAQQAQARHSYLEAELMFSQALEQMSTDGDPKRISACRGRGLMRYRLGRYEDSLKDFELAGQLAHQVGDLGTEVEVLLDAATALDWVDEFRRSKELVEQARALAQTVNSPLIEARLLLGLGRSASRFGQEQQCVELLTRAADCAERLGDAAYETYVISLLLNGYVLAIIGRLEESEQAFDRVIPLCAERGDKLHLGAALGNRTMLWTQRNEKERLLADLRRLREIAREMGNGRMEQCAHVNLGVYLLWLNDFDNAEQSARRAMEIDDRRFGDAARPEAAILVARVLAARGDPLGARKILDEIQARQARVRSGGDREIELLPAEEIFCAMVDLSTRDATDSEWDALQARAVSRLSGQDLLEVLEMRAQTALRQKKTQVARRIYLEALAIANKVPNLIKERLVQQLHQLGGAAA